MTRHQQSSQQNGVPGVWDYVEKKVLRRKPRPLTFEQRAERWLKQVNGGMVDPAVLRQLVLTQW